MAVPHEIAVEESIVHRFDVFKCHDTHDADLAIPCIQHRTQVTNPPIVLIGAAKRRGQLREAHCPIEVRSLT